MSFLLIVIVALVVVGIVAAMLIYKEFFKNTKMSRMFLRTGLVEIIAKGYSMQYRGEELIYGD